MVKTNGNRNNPGVAEKSRSEDSTESSSGAVSTGNSLGPIVKTIPAERFTPFSLARKLQAKALLESASFKKGKERYSVLLVKEAFRLHQEKDEVFFSSEGSDNGNRRKRIRQKGKDILDAVRYFADQHQAIAQGIPLPAGGIGYLSYEFARHCDSFTFIQREDPLELPQASFIFGHLFIVFDHYTDLLYLVGLNYREHSIDLSEAMAEVEEKINDLDFNYLVSEDKEYPALLHTPAGQRRAYLEGVETVKREIEAGNLLQGVLSRRLMVETELPALEAYRNLRSTNPSPYLFYLDYGEYQLFGSSPEVHVKVKDDRAIIRPIAGTRRRGKDRGEDELLERELLADEKERAEHLMLVDLARNDLGRVCKPGSVTLGEYMGIERYSHVMHIVSEATGVLREGITGADVIRATFPAGTVSGAPKIRAVEIIDRLEPIPRSFYAGLVGYVEPGGNLDSCITIRSGLKKDGMMVLQAGAGIVYDSVPEREYEETGEKLGALATALGVEV
jgi:anthranilate synthase component 1